LKLQSAEDSPWLTIVHKRVDSAFQVLTERWQALESSPPYKPRWDLVDLERDCRLGLPRLGPYLRRLDDRPISAANERHFIPSCCTRIRQDAFQLPDVSLIDIGPADIFLADLELWVIDSLDDWLRTNIGVARSAADLSHVIDTYIATAAVIYTGKPEDISILLLTLLKLWVALDKLAVSHHSLLRDYWPVWDCCLFEPLLLPGRSQMVRLDRIEQYALQRRNQAILDSRYIFEIIDHHSSLSVRYFDQSTSHQQLRTHIEDLASAAQARKKAELVSKSNQYHQLLQQSNRLDCTYITRWKKYYTRTLHHPLCEKCRLKTQAQDMKIDVCEWPLPRDDLQAKTAIFELDVPIVLSEWRQTTYNLLVDVFSPTFQQAGTHQGKVYYLHRYVGLSLYAKSCARRLQIASTAKPFMDVSHYKSPHISVATNDSICVNNGLYYSMYDSKTHQPAEELLHRSGIQDKCTLQLPIGTYRTLQFALNTTTYTSNAALASQDSCPELISLHEYYEFVILRAGYRIQWHNIARELISRVLDFKHEAIEMLIRQAAWQVGPSLKTSICREAHLCLEEHEFGLSLLSALKNAIISMEGNWQCVTAMSIFTAVTNRLLSLSPSPAVQQGCYVLLRRVRLTTWRWSRDLSQMHHETEDTKELKDINLKALQVALVCHATFEVDLTRMREFLVTEDDVAILIEAAIIIHDRCPAVMDTLPNPTKIQLRHKDRLAHLLEPPLRDAILMSHCAINRVISHLWEGYQPGTCWTVLAPPNGRWLRTETSSEMSRRVLTVHYDVLAGSLLVDGLPLTRLPRSYELQDNYRRLFGDVRTINDAGSSTD
jgi:hypothetical protein